MRGPDGLVVAAVLLAVGGVSTAPVRGDGRTAPAASSTVAAVSAGAGPVGAGPVVVASVLPASVAAVLAAPAWVVRAPVTTTPAPSVTSTSVPAMPHGESGRGSTGEAGQAVPEARQGVAAASQRLTFQPTAVRLLTGGSRTGPVRVIRVDTAADGSLELPRSVGEVGWWASGALAGEAFGSVVLAGHIDSKEEGLGFLALLLDVRRGDRVELSDGRLLQRYAVRSVKEVDKELLRSAGVFARERPAQLVLITCSGRFDPQTRHYENNLLVVAEPLETARVIG